MHMQAGMKMRNAALYAALDDLEAYLRSGGAYSWYNSGVCTHAFRAVQACERAWQHCTAGESACSCLSGILQQGAELPAAVQTRGRSPSLTPQTPQRSGGSCW